MLLQMCLAVPQEHILLPLSELYDTYQSQGLESIAIHPSLINPLEHSTSGDSFNEWIQEKGIQFPIALDEAVDHDPNDLRSRLGVTMDRYHVNQIPMMFLIDKQGIMRACPEREELKEWIQRLLAE